MKVKEILDQIGKLWTDHQAAIVLGVGAVIVLLLAVVGWRFYRSGAKSKWVGGIAAVTVLAWTSEGLWQVAYREMHLPPAFAVMTFFVFEAMMIAAGMRAEEHRKAKGAPGPAGRFVWILAACSGVISALGGQVAVEYPLRVVLPLLAVGLWWVGITAERDTDTPEMKAERKRLADEREATWTVTPRTLLVRAGVMKPGKSTTTEAQQEYDTARMVVAADTIAIGGRGADRARKRLRRLARTATPEMIEEVSRKVRQAVEAEMLMVPGTGDVDDFLSDGPGNLIDIRDQVAAFAAGVDDDMPTDPWATFSTPLPTATDTASEPASEPATESASVADPVADEPASDTATESASDTATPTATEPASNPPTGPPATPPTDPPTGRTQTAKVPAKKTASQADTGGAKKVLLWHAKMPDATHAEIAKKAGVSVRTVERHRPKAAVNGTHVPDLIDAK